MILEKYYTDLESITSIDTWDLLKQLKPIEEKIDDEYKDRIKTERKILAFSLNNGDLSPKLSRVDSKGDIKSYPDLDKFTDSEIKYLQERLKSVENPWIKSRYSHALWNITRNNQYAKISIDCYLKNIDTLANDSDNESFHKISIFVECVLFIGEKTKQQIESIKENVLSLLKSNKLPNYIKSHVLEIAMANSLVKPKELEFTLECITDWIEFSSEGSFFSNQTTLNTAIKLSEKVQKSPKVFYKLLAENQDLIINQHPDEKDFIRYTSFGEKAKYYKKAGELEKHEECLKEYTRLKNRFELGHIESKLPEKETQLLNDYLNRKSELILEMPIEGILTYFASGDDLLIKEEVLDKMTEEGFKKSFHQFCSTSTFDINSNHKHASDEEVKENERFRNYTIQFSLFVFPLIIKVFAYGMLKGKISYHSVFNFIQANSWYGQRFPKELNERDIDEKSDWLSLLAPGLHDYFSQIEWAVMMSKDNLQNYVLCVDSLTTKFEGAIRDFIRLQGGTTTTEKRGELQEQLLEELLQNKIITKLFKAEDISLFTYVFTKKGWNIRNNVAHCFYPYSNYSFDKATLVFICLLKLGKYKLTYKEK
ncbi:DUF4209 domain-containing protein [Draconibacterium sediminis]|uniref:Uncharacterized protein n=1 Tax=Draconibacterium sediminis TaxID=1544798 RepID=A0A0D8J8H3_9BACT|nr:DUF4209 domain-containing protein [Draconibacterium sediminis]KJF43099.1 hypothetical protein LH29_17120 [Draconibacterium sediminis]